MLGWPESKMHWWRRHLWIAPTALIVALVLWLAGRGSDEAKLRHRLEWLVRALDRERPQASRVDLERWFGQATTEDVTLLVNDPETTAEGRPETFRAAEAWLARYKQTRVELLHLSSQVSSPQQARTYGEVAVTMRSSGQGSFVERRRFWITWAGRAGDWRVRRIHISAPDRAPPEARP